MQPEYNDIVEATGGGSGPQIQRVALALRSMLLRGQFKPGERLAELTLVPLLNASRTPVRLSLERLAHEGLLEAQPSGGFRVRAFPIADVWDAIEVRGVLEGTTARLAAERLEDPAELAAATSIYEEMVGLAPVTPGNFAAYLELNERLHQETWRLAKSPMLTRMIEAVIVLPFAAPGALALGQLESVEGAAEGEVALEQHRAILDAIRNREGSRAESLAREHSRVARRNLERALRDREIFDQIPGASLLKLD